MRFIPGVGVDLDIYRPTEDAGLRARVRDELGIPLDAPFIFVVAELNPEKRQRDALSALALMEHRVPISCWRAPVLSRPIFGSWVASSP